MSGFEVLGAACAIFQTVSFAHEVFNTCYSFYKNKSVAFDQLQAHANDMKAAVAATEQYIQSLQQSAPLDERDLIVVLQKTQTITSQLEAEVAYVLEKRQTGSIARAIRTHVRHARKRSAIATLKSELEDCDRVVKMMLLNRDAQSLNAVSYQLSTGFAEQSNHAKAFIQQLVDRQAETERAASERQQILQADIAGLSGQMVQIHLYTQRADQRLEEEAQKQLLHSLYFPEMETRQNMIDLDVAFFEGSLTLQGTDSKAHSESTPPVASEKPKDSPSVDEFESVVRAPAGISSLQSWIETGQTIFWISGHAGSGKSTLVKYLAEREMQHARSKRGAQPVQEVLAHYFWKAGASPMQRSRSGCLCSLIYQMLQNDSSRYQPLLQSDPTLLHKKSPGDWSRAELQRVFTRMISASQKKFILFFDGLDEVGSDDELFPVLDMIETQSELTNTRFCVSSRPEFILEQRLGQYPTMHVHEMTQESMTSYVKATLDPVLRRSRKGWTEPEIEHFVEAIVRKAEGIFLWLVLAVDIVRRGVLQGEDYGKVSRRLDSLPSKLERLFTDMWERMGADFASNQKLAASFINTVVMQRLTHQTARIEQVYDYVPEVRNLIIALLTADPEGAFRMFGTERSAGISDQVMWLEDRRHDLITHSMGLLVCVGKNFMKKFKAPDDSDAQGQLSYRLSQLIYQDVDFVHRSAFDYFTTTAPGQAISAKSGVSLEAACLSLARAYAFEVGLLARSSSMIPPLHFQRNRKNAHNAITALTWAIRVDKRLLDQRLKHILQDLEHAYELTPGDETFYATAVRHEGMLEILVEVSPLSAEQASLALRHYWRDQPCSTTLEGIKRSTPRAVVKSLVQLGAKPYEKISVRSLTKPRATTTAFNEFLLRTCITLMRGKPSREYEQLRVGWTRPNAGLGAMYEFLNAYTGPDQTFFYELDARKSGGQQIFWPLYTNLSLFNRGPAEGDGTVIHFGLSNLWVSELILSVLTRPDSCMPDEDMALIAHIRDRLASLKRNDGTSQEGVPRVTHVFKYFHDTDSWSWKADLDKASAGQVIEAMFRYYLVGGRDVPERDPEVSRYLELLLWADNPASWLVYDEALGVKFAKLPCADMRQWPQRSTSVRGLTRAEATERVETGHFDDVPFILHIDTESGLIYLDTKVAPDTDAS